MATMRIQTTIRRVFNSRQMSPGAVAEVSFKQGRLLTRLGRGWIEASPEDLGAPAPAIPDAPKRRGRSPRVIEESDQGQGKGDAGNDTVAAVAEPVAEGLLGDQSNDEPQPENQAEPAPDVDPAAEAEEKAAASKTE